MVHESESIKGFYLFNFKNLSLYNHNVGDRGTEKRKEKEARRRGAPPAAGYAKALSPRWALTTDVRLPPPPTFMYSLFCLH